MPRDFLAGDGQVIDSGLAIFFSAPASFTGEDVLELHGHGSPLLADLLLARLLELGARLARPGEFSERAFLNGKLDLLQAEAIADLIDSATAQAARSALRTLNGAFSRQVADLVEHLTALRTQLEASIDFPEDDLDALDPGLASTPLTALERRLGEVLASARQGQILRDGFQLTIAGRPNVGKSSLLNALAGRETAIVTEYPGTTRDLLQAHLQVAGVPLLVVDTAGIRDPADPVEAIGVERARRAVQEADVVLLVVDARVGVQAEDVAILNAVDPLTPRAIALNKIDLTSEEPAVAAGPAGRTVSLSAKTGAGLGLLQGCLRELVGYNAEEGVFIARRRHLEALRQAHGHLQRAIASLPRAELVAEDLRQAQRALAELTGEVTTEELLEQIFSSFCIGK
jgi:tRNA modification GTPase